MIRTTTAVVALCAAPALASQTASYGWEDGGTIFGYYNSGSGEITATNSSDQAYSGSSSLEIVEDPTGGTPQIWIGFVTGLQDGDTIDASFWAFDDSEGSSPSVRIWGAYALSSDVSSYEGSAGGNSTYSEGTGWGQLSHSWTFDSDGGTRDALVIQIRMYSDSDSSPIYVDDLEVTTSSDTAVINFAPAPGALALLGLAGLAARRRRG